MADVKKFMTRRNLLLSGVAAAAVATGGAWLYPRGIMAQTGYNFNNPLNIPPLDPGSMKAGKRNFDLTIQTGVSKFFKGFKTDTRGINGRYLGPVLRFRKGEVVRLNVTNTLDDDTTLHWHGFNLPARADGGPHQVIKPATTWSPEFEVRENASTMWYHSHLLGKTAAQVWSGLASMIIIDDDQADALALPKTYGVDDIPMVLQDRRFYKDGSMPYRRGMRDNMAGMIGNFPTVNGTIQPHLAVTTTKVRLRLLNGANASIYTLAFKDGRQFQQIASDGGLLAAPVNLTRLRIAPGERAEIVVDFSDGKKAVLQSLAVQASGGMMSGGQSPAFEFIEFRPGPTLIKSADLPPVLAQLPTPDPALATKNRRFLLQMGMGMMFGGGFSINGKEMDPTRIDTVVKKGEVEIWEIANAGPMAHPFHIHNTQFRILDRNGRPPAANEVGHKDTVLVPAGESVRVLIRFDNYTDKTRPYMYHCHILEHEDGGMMGQFTVV